MEETLHGEPAFVWEVLKTVGALVTVLDRQGRIVSFNRACEEATGYSVPGVKGKCVWDFLLVPDEVEPVKAVFAQLRAGQFPNEYENHWVAKDGTRRLIHWTNTCLTDSSGAVEYVIGTGVEVTERRRAEQELRASEARFRALAQNSSDIITLLDGEGTVLYQSPSIERLLGYRPEERMGRNVFRDPIVHPDDQAAKRAFFEAARSHRGTPVTAEFRLRHADGSWRYVEAVGQSFLHDPGIAGIVANYRDVTDRKNAEEALRRQAQLLHLSYDAVLVWRRDGGIEHWSRGAEQLYGFTESEALGQVTHKLLKTVHPAPWPEIEAEMRKRGQWEGELRHYAKDGHEVTVSARHQLVLGTDGIERILETNRDVTDRKRAEEALRESEHRHRLLAETMLQGVVHQNADGTIIAMNPAAERILGKTRADFLGSSSVREEHHTIREDGSPFPGLEHPSMVALRAGRPVRGVVMGVWNSQRNERRWIEIDAVPLFAPGGKQPVEVYTVFADVTDRKRAEAALARERDLLQSVLNSAGKAHLVYLDRDFNFVRVNEAYAATCGCRPEEMIGKNHFALYPGAENEAIFRRVRDTGEPFEVRDKPFEFPDQPERGVTYWDWTLIPVKDADGQVAGLIFSLFETTARVRAEEALRESESRFHHLFEEDLTGDFLCTPEGRILLCNAAYADIFGFSSTDAAVGANVLELYPDPGERASVLATLRAQGKLAYYETWRRRRDGTPIHVVENLLGHFNDQGELYEIQGYVFDDTERKRAEEALRQARDDLELRVAERTAELQRANERLRQENEERLQTEQSLRLEEARLDALLRLSQISDVPLDEITGFTLEKAIALTDSRIGFVGFLNEDETVYTLHSVSRDVVRDCSVEGDPMQWSVSDAGIWAEAIRQRRTLIVNDYHRPQPRKKGLPPGHLPIERFMVVPILENKRIVAIAGVANKGADYDASDERQVVLLLRGMWANVQRNRAREELQKAYNELEDKVKQRTAELAAAKAAAEAATEAKSRFLASMSHELRTPMNAILGMIDVALPKATQPTVRDCLQTAKGSADLLLTLLNDLLDSAKIEAGKLELEAAPFSLRRMLDQIARVLSVRASEKGLRFSCHVPDQTPDAVIGDQVRLQQVLFNLSGNAIKFTERGNVEVVVRNVPHENEACLEFAVRDSGIGIPPSVQERLFQPFNQADVSMARRFGGTGLGLSISKSLVEMMGGTIWVKSEVGKGSTFHFSVRLPLATEALPELEPPAALPGTAARQLRILLVEDNLANQKVAAYILQDRGHIVEVAGDGHEAIGLAEQNRYDAILMDVQMPGMDGLEATAVIRKRDGGGSRVPIIAMTARAMESDRQRCLAAGMDGYLSKPINAGEMISLVESLACGTCPPPGVSTQASEAREAAPPSDAAIFDPDEALSRCFDNTNMVHDMIQYFFEDTENLFPKMREALAAGDLVETGRLGHRLKGTVVYLAAQQAQQAALAVERFVTGDGTPAEAEQAVDALERECLALKAVLSGHPLASKPTVDDSD